MVGLKKTNQKQENKTLLVLVQSSKRLQKLKKQKSSLEYSNIQIFIGKVQKQDK